MKIKMRDSSIVSLSSDAEIGIRESASRDNRILAAIAELGGEAIKTDGEFVPLGGSAYFDSHGCGPYDWADQPKEEDDEA